MHRSGNVASGAARIIAAVRQFAQIPLRQSNQAHVQCKPIGTHEPDYFVSSAIYTRSLEFLSENARGEVLHTVRYKGQ